MKAVGAGVVMMCGGVVMMGADVVMLGADVVMMVRAYVCSF